ncbi:hypothetical protein [Pseudophaeobacter sp. TrK17]|uniref:hypothetical protein n=1 Tax=Pseudophaeobacter sp. TrK17 TaxID=2815167 RepID=UPI0035CF5049
MAKRRTRRKPSRRSGGRGRKSNNNVLWIITIIGCLGLVVGVAVVAQNLIAKGKIDEATLCHSGGPQNVTSVLLDLTDPLSETQQARLKTILANEVSGSSVDTMIALGIVSEDPSRWGAMFAKCKPASGQDANGLYENPAIIAARYDREFTAPIQATLQTMLTGASENQSPIMEALQSLVSTTPSFTQARGHRKIIIVSDMLQHSDNLSFYRGQGWDYFVGKNGEGRMAGNLAGVTIEILRIPRSGRTPSNEITEGFWTRYFDRQGSRPPSVSSLGDL